MKLLILGFLFGILVTQVPDAVGLYGDFVTNSIKPQECHFDVFHNKFAAENPKLLKAIYYFQLGGGPLYWIGSGRCSNRTFYNPSATREFSGKITSRNYFYSQCSHFYNDVSDLFFK